MSLLKGKNDEDLLERCPQNVDKNILTRMRRIVVESNNAVTQISVILCFEYLKCLIIIVVIINGLMRPLLPSGARRQGAMGSWALPLERPKAAPLLRQIDCW